jgi:chromate transporter
VVAGVSFILPAALLTAGVAAAYVRFGRLPQFAGVLYGVKPVIIAVVVQALWGLARSAVRTPLLAAVAVAAFGATALGAHELAVVFVAGAAVVALRRAPGAAGVLAVPVLTAAVPAAPAVGLAALFLVFLKIGSVLFGSGYVLLAFLRADLVERAGWITEGQLLDAVAVGQITPGPVFSTATFVGYLVAGAPGAAVATVGIFLPAFVFVALSGPLVPRLRRSPLAADFLDGVNVGSLALMGVVTAQLGRAAVVDVPSAALALAGAVALLCWRVGSAWLVVAGGLVGWLVRR